MDDRHEVDMGTMVVHLSCPNCGQPSNVEVGLGVTVGQQQAERQPDPSRSLVVYQSTNRAGRKDATGAFKPEALAFQKLHDIAPGRMLPVPHGLTAANKARRVLDYLEGVNAGALDAFIYFGHGTATSFPSMGFGRGSSFYGDRRAYELAAQLGRVGSDRLVVALYACTTGKGFGVADWLGDMLRETWSKPGARVFAHRGKGHTTKYPFAEYSGEGTSDEGIAVIERTDPLWKAWVARLQDDQAFRLGLPFMTQDEIREALA